MSAPLCRKLDWDSDFFGFPVGRVVESDLTEAQMREVLDWCATEQIRCLYLLTGADKLRTARLAEASGFHLADIRVTLDSTPRADARAAARVRSARPDDVPELAEIAAVSHTDSRFFNDPGFSRERCAALYRVWIEKSCAGSADAVLVSDYEGRAAGYITCHIDGETGSIGLIAVGAAARGMGLGRDLVAAALDWFAARGIRRVSVVTQGGNIPALRMYEREGFRVFSTELWYHRWFAAGGSD